MKKEKIKEFRLKVHPFDVSSEDIREMPQNFVRAAFDDGITQGIEFAETELQNIAIEFAEWVINEHIGKEYKLPYFKITDNTLLNEFINTKN